MTKNSQPSKGTTIKIDWNSIKESGRKANELYFTWVKGKDNLSGNPLMALVKGMTPWICIAILHHILAGLIGIPATIAYLLFILWYFIGWMQYMKVDTFSRPDYKTFYMKLRQQKQKDINKDFITRWSEFNNCPQPGTKEWKDEFRY